MLLSGVQNLPFKEKGAGVVLKQAGSSNEGILFGGKRRYSNKREAGHTPPAPILLIKKKQLKGSKVLK